MTCRPLTLGKRAVARTVEHDMDGRKCLANGSTCRNCGKKNHWQCVCHSSGNHNRPRQRETQRYAAKQLSAPRQRSQSRPCRPPHDSDVGIKKRIAPTLLHSHQLLLKHLKHCHLTVLKMKAVTLVTKSSR